jgi:hypothetical protein
MNSFWDFIWAMIVFYFLFMVIWMFIGIFSDILRRNDLSGWAKALWLGLIFFLPFLGILVYMIVRPKMTEQDKELIAQAKAQEARLKGGSAADDIAKAHALLEKGAISQAEFDDIKKKALA